ncbi:hypothetical protein RZS08_43370, partial [Arthrospira platensis SPKY1]|nr:hypothetical protein [Arthrospira platensis SPKY1]
MAIEEESAQRESLGHTRLTITDINHTPHPFSATHQQERVAEKPNTSNDYVSQKFSSIEDFHRRFYNAKTSDDKESLMFDLAKDFQHLQSIVKKEEIRSTFRSLTT